MVSDFMVSVIIPAFNEELNIKPLCDRLIPVLENYPNYEVIFIDDGSRDGTVEKIKEIKVINEKIKFISFSRNFGHQSALRAGMKFAKGDCVISMDCDLQHPPELIEKMVEKWKDGYRIVYTIRADKENISFLKRKTSHFFYKLFSKLSDIKLPQGAADFRLLDKLVVDVIGEFNEGSLFLRGLIPWVGFDQYAIEYVPEKRFAGKTKYSIRKMISFAITGITSFSIKPLRIATYLGFFIAGLSFLYAFYALYIKLFTEKVMSGWTSLLVSVLFLAGIQLITFGIMGEYIGKLFIESKGRPNYIIKEKEI